MQLTNNHLQYGIVAQLLHWAIVALIIAQFVLANHAQDLPLGVEKINTLALHKSLGITILGLAVLRLSWRLVNVRPAPPMGTARWQRAAASASHFLLYVLMFAIPLVGWLMSSARNFSVSWFGLVTLPDLIARDETAFRVLRTTHEVLAKTLFVVAAVHTLAALKHQFIDKDDVLKRMLPFGHSRRETS